MQPFIARNIIYCLLNNLVLLSVQLIVYAASVWDYANFFAQVNV